MLFVGCDHTVQGFRQYGYLDNKRDPLMQQVFKHESNVHGDIPMTKEEVEDACYKQWRSGIAVVHTRAKPLAESQASPCFPCLLDSPRPTPGTRSCPS